MHFLERAARYGDAVYETQTTTSHTYSRFSLLSKECQQALIPARLASKFLIRVALLYVLYLCFLLLHASQHVLLHICWFYLTYVSKVQQSFDIQNTSYNSFQVPSTHSIHLPSYYPKQLVRAHIKIGKRFNQSCLSHLHFWVYQNNSFLIGNTQPLQTTRLYLITSINSFFTSYSSNNKFRD